MKQQDLLVEEENYLPEADNGVRIANFLIDTIVYYIIILVISTIITLLFFTMNEELATELFLSETESVGFTVASYILTYLIVFLYYFIAESTTQRSIGKFITGTIVVTESGEKPSAKQIAIRSVSRLVPFDPLSFFGHGWHDKWSDTYVVKKKDLMMNT